MSCVLKLVELCLDENFVLKSVLDGIMCLSMQDKKEDLYWVNNTSKILFYINIAFKAVLVHVLQNDNEITCALKHCFQIDKWLNGEPFFVSIIMTIILMNIVSHHIPINDRPITISILSIPTYNSKCFYL